MMAYDRTDRPRDERFREDDRFRSGRDDHRDQGGRGFFERAGDEISSWFGDEEAERRRGQDDRSGGLARHEPDRGERGGFFGGNDHNQAHNRERERERDRDRERGSFFGGSNRDRDRHAHSPQWDREQDQGRRDYGGQGQSRSQSDGYRPFAGDYGRGSSERHGGDVDRGARSLATTGAVASTLGREKNHDPHYQEWRQRQIDQLDRDYDEYRREHQSKFDNDFSGWRSQRQTKRQTLGQVREHMEVVGSDEQTIGKVDKVQDDRIILTKDSQGGVHTSFASAAIDRVEGDRLILLQSAEEARRSLKEERGFSERNPADQRGFGSPDRQQEQTQGDGPHILERSFSGTYPDEPNR